MKGLWQILVLGICFGIWSPLVAQRTEYYTSEYALFRDALDLFDKQKYAAGRVQFEAFLRQQVPEHDQLVEQAHYYIAVCAMELFNDDADELLKRFVRNYPESIRANKARYQLGKFYYRNRKWEDAIVHYLLVDERRLSSDELHEYHFKLGYALFQEERYDEAYGHFEAVMDRETEYAAPASYYYAHIAYQKGYNQVALERFLKIDKDARFSSISPYYITQIYYLQKRYDQLIEYAVPILDTVKVQKGAEMARMLGDAYYRQEKFDEAAPYLEQYHRARAPSREDKYQLGYAYYRSRQHLKAISMFTRVVGRDDSLSQIAYYHLGDAYLKTEQPNYARTAFREASALDMDLKIQEDALFNYAKLAYELSYNPYDEAINAFETYINNYPNSSRVDEAYTYLLKVYMTTRNYEAALASIEKVEHKGVEVKRAYQMLAYNRGVELYQNGKFSKSIAAFNKVDRYPVEIDLIASAAYWIAECHYKSDDLNKAIQAFKHFQKVPGAYKDEHYPLANYNIGYAYYKQKDYKLAIEHLRKFADDVKGNDKLAGFLNDAYLRIADAYFLTLDNEAAITFYQKAAALNEPNEDYAVFQKSMALGYEQEFDKKISALEGLINQFSASMYQANARFEIAESYRLIGEKEKAIDFYQQVIEQYPSNLLVRKALLNSALIYFKDRNYAQSEKLYLRVLSEYPNPEDCRTAIDGLRDVYSAIDRIEEWEKVLASTSCAGYGEGNIDSTFFNAAKNLFYEGDCLQAVESFSKYLQRFPTGVFVTDAHYFKAECLFNLGKMDEALVSFESVLKRPSGKFTESALSKASDLNFGMERYQEAFAQYNRLEKLATFDAHILQSRIGQMKCLFELKRFEEAIGYADMVLKEEKLEEHIKHRAHLIIGISLKELVRYDDALNKLRYTNTLARSEVGAEAKYHAAHVLYLQGKFKLSEAEIFEMVQQKPSYDYWLAKAYILLADNYVMLEDIYQAKETLKSIIQYYEGDNGIREEAQQKLDAILEMEAEQENKRTMEKVMEIDNDKKGEAEFIYQDLREDKKDPEEKNNMEEEVDEQNQEDNE